MKAEITAPPGGVSLRRGRFAMKSVLIVAALVVTGASPSFATPGWTVRPSGLASTLYDVALTDTARATAVGAGGVILQTTDAGAHWTVRPSGVTDDLFAVSFGDALHGI